MAFSDYVYESDSGVSFLLRLDSDQAGVSGAVAGAPDVAAHVRVSSTRREFGVQPRFITAKRVVGAGAAAKTFSTKLPIATPGAYAALAVGAAVNINGTAYVVASRTPELLR